MRKLIINHFYSLSVKGISVILSFLFAKIYVDLISEEEYGLFILNYGYLLLFSTLIGSGPGFMVLHQIRDKERNTVDAASYLLINIFICICLCLFLKISYIFLYTILISGISVYFNEAMRSNSSGNVYIYLKDIVRTLACILLCLLGLKSSYNILFWSSIINIGIIVIYAVLANKSLFITLNFSEISWNNLKYSYSVSFSNTLQVIKIWIELYLSGIFLSPKEVGLFSVLQKLAKLISLPLNALNADIANNILESSKNGKLDTKLKHQLLITKVTSIFIAVFCFLILGYFLRLYNFNVNSVNYLVGILLITTNLVNSLFGPVGLFSQLSKEMSNIYLFSNILSIIVTIILSWIFLSSCGIISLSIINLIIMTAWNSFLYFSIKNKIGILL